MITTFDFDKQLTVGNSGESLFLKYYKKLGPVKSKDWFCDFVLKDKKTVEIKTDTYDMNKTNNFFMEMFGNITESKMGGPWRGMQDGVDYFVYYFLNNNTFFWFDTSILCNRLDELISRDNIQPKDIRNKSWITRGYLIPRIKLIDIYRQDTF